MKKSVLYNLIISIFIFLLGIVYLSFPTYYGLETMSKVETYNLFFSFTLIYSLLNLSSYFIDKKNNRNNLVYFFLIAIVNIYCYVLTKSIQLNIVVPLSIMALLFFLTSFGVIKVSNMKNDGNSYYYMEIIFLVILSIFGIILSFNMLTDFVLQTIMLGFFISVVGVIDFLNYILKYLMKDKDFVKSVR